MVIVLHQTLSQRLIQVKLNGDLENDLESPAVVVSLQLTPADTNGVCHNHFRKTTFYHDRRYILDAADTIRVQNFEGDNSNQVSQALRDTKISTPRKLATILTQRATVQQMLLAFESTQSGAVCH